MKKGLRYGKGHLDQGNWVRASFYLFRIDYVNKRREGHLRVVLKMEIKSFSDMLRIPRRL